MNQKTIVRFAVREIMGAVLLGVALFWAAGRLDWWAAWALIALTLAWSAATAIVILRLNPDLLAERLGRAKGGKRWDRAIMSIVGLVILARPIVAGLDQRYGWSGGISLLAQIAALVVCALGYALLVWATGSNAYFSQIVRIQDERGHAVAMGGPYRWVRHPGYAGTILYELAAPILLASWWALIPSAVSVILFVVRTALEDKTLRIELPGYVKYAEDVPWRLVPGVW
jgi:protein-S-isoprenylcysteine O-methyltransferase Ste14